MVLLYSSHRDGVVGYYARASRHSYIGNGVGVPSTLFQLTKRLHQIDYDPVIMAGIAGTFQHDWQPAGSCVGCAGPFWGSGCSGEWSFQQHFQHGFV